MMPWRGRAAFSGGGGGGFRGGPRFSGRGGGGGNWQQMGGFPQFGGPSQSDRFGDSSEMFGGQGPSDRFGESQGMFGGPRFGHNRGRGGFNRQNREFPRNFNHRDRDRNNSEPQSNKWEFKQEDSKPEPDVGPSVKAETEPQYDESLCILDWYNSDLNCSITPTDFCSVTAMSSRGFAYMWAGARATHGATRGRVCYEVRVDGNQNVGHLENETAPHVIRCGWSVKDSDLQLGEVKNSYGYGGTSKISDNCKFQSYGKPFGVGDVVGCYLDMNNDPVIMKFTVNGVDQGVAFRVAKSELGGEALFPHILTKNQDYTVNFGQLPGPMFPLLKGFTPIGQLDTSDGLRRGHRAPASREDCEVLMMIGLPGAGKTFWAEQHKRNNPEKNYNILGTNNLIDKMKVDGLSRKRNYSGRWEELIRQCTECFNKLLELASNRKRNYILDQTNVFPTARGKKMRPFVGFQCKAIVVVPSDHEFRRRVQVREARDGKEVPDAAVLNMKANFVLPDFEETFFSSVFYTELSPEDTHAIVIQYNAEAISLGQNPTSAVSTFKARNEQQRAAAGVHCVPGQLLVSSAGPLTLQGRGTLQTLQGEEDSVQAGGSRAGKRSRSSDRQNSDRRRSRSRERKARRGSRSRDSRRRSRSRERPRRKSRERTEFRKDVDLKWQTQVQSINQHMPSPWLSGGPGNNRNESDMRGTRPNPFTNFSGPSMQGSTPSLPNFGVMNERELATFVTSNPNFLANLGPNFQNSFNMQAGNQNMDLNMGDNSEYQDQDMPRKTLLGSPPENKPFTPNKFSKGPNSWGSSDSFDKSSHERVGGAQNQHNTSQSSFNQQFNKPFGNPRGKPDQEGRGRGGRNSNVDFSKPPPGFGGGPSFTETSKPQNNSLGPRGFSNDPNPFMIPGNLVQSQRQGPQYNQSHLNQPPSQGMNQQDTQQQNRGFGQQRFSNSSSFQPDQRSTHKPFKQSQGMSSTNFQQSNFNRNSRQVENQNNFNSKFNPMEPSSSFQGQQSFHGGRQSSSGDFGQEMFQRRERNNQSKTSFNQRQNYGKSSEFSGGQTDWNNYQGDDEDYDQFSRGRQNRSYNNQSQPPQDFSAGDFSRQPRHEAGGRGWNPGNQMARGKHFDGSQTASFLSSSGRSQEESWADPLEAEREDSHSRRSAENVKSAGDRRMERELGSGVIKNPFDPSNRIEARPKHNRLNEEFDEPCMNPEAPDPPEASGSSKETTAVEKGKTETGAPDYAALLQYLQFYQKQMEDDKKK